MSELRGRNNLEDELNCYTIDGSELENLDDRGPKRYIKISARVKDLPSLPFSKIPKSEETLLGHRVENILKGKFCVGLESCKPYFSNRIRYKGEQIQCTCHDCGDTACLGNGRVFYLTYRELENILKGF